MSDKNDMTNGPILRKLLYLAVPIMGSQLLQMAYNLTDMFWLGRLGSNELAATAVAGLYLWLGMAFMLVGSVGASIGVSQAVGSGNKDRAKSFTQTALLISVLSGVVYAAVMIVFRHSLVGFFNFQEKDVVLLAENYLAIVAVTIPLTYVTATLGASFTSTGNSRIPFICNMTGTLINVVFDPILIFTFNLGVTGAAIATAGGQTIVCVMLLIFMKRSKNRPFETIRFIVAPTFENIKQIIKWTLPICAESLLFTFLVMVTSRREIEFGADATAMSRVGSQIESLTWLLGGAFGSALVSFIGQNTGAKQWERIRTVFKISTLAMIIYGAFVSFILAVPGKFIFEMFLPTRPDLVERSVLYLRIMAICQIPLCLEAVSSNMFRGLGKTMPPALINTTCNIIRVLIVYLLSAKFLHIGLPGIWIGVTISACIKGIWSYTWGFFTEYRKLKNKNIMMDDLDTKITTPHK